MIYWICSNNIFGERRAIGLIVFLSYLFVTIFAFYLRRNYRYIFSGLVKWLHVEALSDDLREDVEWLEDKYWDECM